MKFTEWGSKRQKSWYRQMRRKERKEYQDANNIGWDFKSLFEFSDGAWYDLQPPNIYADTSLSSPAVIAGGIAGVMDTSGNGYNATQPTSTARPILGRVPVGGRRNLLTDTEAFDLNWAFQNTTRHLVVGPDGTMTAAEVTQSTSSGLKRLRGFFSLDQVTTVRGRAWLKAGTISNCAVRIFGSGSVFAATVNLEAGTTTAGTITDKGDGWFELDTGSVALDGLNNRTFEFYPGGTGVEEGDGTSSIIIWHPDLRLASLDGPYQRVGNEYDITEAGVPSVYYARYDGADDVLPANLTIPSITNGTFILVGSNGVWIDSEYTNTTLSLSVGPTTYTNGPEGILAVVGDLLAFGFLDRQLTESEVDKVRAAGVKRGAPNVELTA